MKTESEYSKLLRDPRWQKKRLEILQRDEWMCQSCQDTTSTLHIHHKRYIHGKKPWEYPNQSLITLCDICHEAETELIKEYQEQLIEQIRDKFLADDIISIAHAFYKLETIPSPSVCADSFDWFFSYNDGMNKINELYFEYLKKNNIHIGGEKKNGNTI